MTYGSEYEAKQKVVNYLVSRLGTQEGSYNHQAIIECYNTISPLPRGVKATMSMAWCAIGVSAAFHNAGLDDLIKLEMSAEYMLQGCKKMGIVNKANPSYGDVVFYNWDNLPDCDHVGIVTSYNDTTGIMKVIECNKSDTIDYRTIALVDSLVMGIAHPNYKSHVKTWDYENLGWNWDGKGWWYATGHSRGEYHKNNAVRIGGKLYFFDTEGYCVYPNNIQCNKKGYMEYINGERVGK